MNSKLFAMLLMLCFSAMGQPLSAATGAPIKDYPFEQVAENTWVIHGPLEMPNVSNQDYLQAIYSSAQKAFDDGLDSSDVKAISLQATKKYEDWSGYNEELGPQGAQAYLEVEAAEF